MTQENKNKMAELGFGHFKKLGCDCWVKTYVGFRLYIAESVLGFLYASVEIGKLEISLPEIKEFEWIIAFDNENDNTK